jgi:hypothetical protein
LVSDEKHPTIRFSQNDIIAQLAGSAADKKLEGFMRRFGGLCELVSNLVIAHDLMGADEKSLLKSQITRAIENGGLRGLKSFVDPNIQFLCHVLFKCKNKYEKTISLEEVHRFSDTHIIDVSFFS